LAHRTFDEIEKKGIQLFPDHRVTTIIPDRKHILATDVEGRSKTFSYDRLVIGTGGVSLVPNLTGIDLPGVFFLRWMADSFAFQEYLAIRRPTSIVIIGAGSGGIVLANDLRQKLGTEHRIIVIEQSATHAFAHIRLTDNVVQFTTRRYRDNPLIVQGPGAGPEFVGPNPHRPSSSMT